MTATTAQQESIHAALKSGPLTIDELAEASGIGRAKLGLLLKRRQVEGLEHDGANYHRRYSLAGRRRRKRKVEAEVSGDSVVELEANEEEASAPRTVATIYREIADHYEAIEQLKAELANHSEFREIA